MCAFITCIKINLNIFYYKVIYHNFDVSDVGNPTRSLLYYLKSTERQKFFLSQIQNAMVLLVIRCMENNLMKEKAQQFLGKF
jgi:hypothetical protein